MFARSQKTASLKKLFCIIKRNCFFDQKTQKDQRKTFLALACSNTAKDRKREDQKTLKNKIKDEILALAAVFAAVVAAY